MGFQAGQHEILSETFSKIIPIEIQKKVRDISENTKTNLKEANKISEDLESRNQHLEKTKKKYHKSFTDWKSAKANYLKAEEDGMISRKDIAKLKSMVGFLNVECEDYRGVYASQLMKTNKFQSEYYHKKLPAVLNNLQNIEIGRIDYLKHVMDRCVDAEKHSANIIDKCREDMDTSIEKIDPVADSDLLIDRLKTGNVPPHDLSFEDIPGEFRAKYGTLVRTKSKPKLNKPEENKHLFPRKRDIEERIKWIESDIIKGHKEIKAIQIMVQSYKQNPKFGNPLKFQEELEVVILKVQKLESELHSLNQDLTDVNQQLEQKNRLNKSPLITPRTISKIGSDSPGGSRSSSAGYGTISNYSGSDKDSESIENSENEESIETVVALYPYSGECGESTIAMEAGEEFIVTEGDDEGWTKVRRKNIDSQEREGFVPSAFLHWL